jgi:hypothetical protein
MTQLLIDTLKPSSPGFRTEASSIGREGVFAVPSASRISKKAYLASSTSTSSLSRFSQEKNSSRSGKSDGKFSECDWKSPEQAARPSGLGLTQSRGNAEKWSGNTD